MIYTRAGSINCRLFYSRIFCVLSSDFYLLLSKPILNYLLAAFFLTINQSITYILHNLASFKTN